MLPQQKLTAHLDARRAAVFDDAGNAQYVRFCSRVFFHRRDNHLKLHNKGGYFVTHGVPDSVHVNGELPVHEPVPHSNDVYPRDRIIISLKFFAYGRGGLTDDFDAFDKGESEHPVGFEVAPRSASCKFDRVARGVEHVAKPE